MEQELIQKANETKGHPLVPKLDLNRVTIEVDDGSNEVTPHLNIECDIDDDEGIQSSNKKYFEPGSELVTTTKRMNSLEQRKKLIINILYKQCNDKKENTGEMLEDVLGKLSSS